MPPPQKKSAWPSGIQGDKTLSFLFFLFEWICARQEKVLEQEAWTPHSECRLHNAKHFPLSYLRPSSHRTRKQVCTQICTQILWSCRQCCVNTPIGNNMFHFLLATFASTSASCVNGTLRTEVLTKNVLQSAKHLNFLTLPVHKFGHL